MRSRPGWRGRRGGQGGPVEPPSRRAAEFLPTGESAVAAGLCGLYLLATFAFAPDYFPLVRELAGSYSRFIRVTLLESLVGPGPALALAGLVLAAGLRQLDGARPLRRVLVAATLAYAVAALLQFKGFRYHWYPAMALALMVLAVLVPLARHVKGKGTIRLFASVAMAALAVTVVMTGAGAARQGITPHSPDWDADPSIGLLLPLLEADGARGEGLAVLSPNMASGFPLTNYAGTTWPLRFSNLWPAISEYRDELDAGRAIRLRAASALTPTERRGVRSTVDDLEAALPERLLIMRHYGNPRAPYTTRVGIQDFLARDRRYGGWLSQYDSVGTVGMYSYWRLRMAGAASLAAVGDVQWPTAAGTPAGVALGAGALPGAVVFLVVLLWSLARPTPSPDPEAR